ncbi:TetR family transcriptional regulator C-terminal domain-containing protein [Phytomonospora sp. NPDC050363]|uniref:TetR/AcrR family transcriptional regulator n=1 Tax=Phytomonospora sp. NPDC050363 TaxID=3155642 RepID=UPI0033CEC156
MPKRVDHEARRQKIAEALWRIAGTRGLDKASLREVAHEAGISLGQLQHYFAGRDEMLVFASNHISELADRQIRARLAAAFPDRPPTPYEMLRVCLRGMLPLDDNTRTGILVQIAYFSRAVRDARMREPARKGIPPLLAWFAELLRAGVERGEIAADRDLDAEAMLLLALADGLTTYVMLEVHEAERAAELIDYQLGRLFEGVPAPG